jgi:hypothetical protein
MSYDYDAYQEVPATAQLADLGKLIQDLERAKKEEAEAEEKLEEKRKVVVQLEQHTIPELMLAMNCRRHETASGLIVSLDETIRCSVPEANRERCWKWLETNGHGAIIKDSVVIQFGAKEHEQAVALMERLKTDNHNVKSEQRVESASLRALIRKLLEQGVDVPMEMFGAFQQQRAVIKTKKSAENF